MDRKEAERHIGKRVHELYYGEDMNCARTTLTSLGEVLSVSIADETMDSAIGLHGAGGFRAQCGLVEGGLMFIGLYSSRKGLAIPETVVLCRNYAESFQGHFGSLSCRDLRPNGFNPDDPPHLCEGLTVRAILFTLDYVLDHLGEKE